MAQNGPAIEEDAERAMAKQKTLMARPGEKLLTTRAMPPANAENAMCQAALSGAVRVRADQDHEGRRRKNRGTVDKSPRKKIGKEQ